MINHTFKHTNKENGSVIITTIVVIIIKMVVQIPYCPTLGPSLSASAKVTKVNIVATRFEIM